MKGRRDGRMEGWRLGHLWVEVSVRQSQVGEDLVVFLGVLFVSRDRAVPNRGWLPWEPHFLPLLSACLLQVFLPFVITVVITAINILLTHDGGPGADLHLPR